MLGDLLIAAGLSADLADFAGLAGLDPVLPSTFAVGCAAQTSIAAAAFAAAEFGRARGLPPQRVAVDMTHAAAQFQSERILRADGHPIADLWDALAGAYRCRDGWVRLHTNFPHHRKGIVALLECADTREGVERTVLAWCAEDLETAAAESGLVVAAMCSFEVWDRHPQAGAIAALPLIAIERVGDADPRPLSKSEQPLKDIRVLDLTRIIAGPVCGRALAGFGADVLNVTSPHLPFILPLVVDMGRGKRNAQFDLNVRDDRAAFGKLTPNADVFLQSYRPGGLDALGFGPDELARRSPGIVYASMSAYGCDGPWRSRRGFDSLVQTATGFNVAEAEAFGQSEPRPLPVQALDHAAGYLLSLGAMAALQRQRRDGGSWHVQVSLARTALWLRTLGRVACGVDRKPLGETAIETLCESVPSAFGVLRMVRSASVLSATPVRFAWPPTPLAGETP